VIHPLLSIKQNQIHLLLPMKQNPVVHPLLFLWNKTKVHLLFFMK